MFTFVEDHFLITIPWLSFDPSPGSVNVAVPLTRDPLIDWYRSCVPHNNNNTISSISIDRCSSLLDRRIRSALASGCRVSARLFVVDDDGSFAVKHRHHPAPLIKIIYIFN